LVMIERRKRVMATQQTAGTGEGAMRAPGEAPPAPQMEAAQTNSSPKAPRVLAAFGTGGGAAIVFSDFASI
jgi:hypothetical protein